MHHRLTQHRHHNPHQPQPPVEDLRMRLNKMREQRESDEAAGIPPADDSYLHNLPKHERHAGFPNEKKAAAVVSSNNRPVGKVEWDEGKTLNIKVEVSKTGERMYKMDKDKALKVLTSPEKSNAFGKSNANNIIKNEHEPGTKTRGRGRYRGAPRGRGYFRGRGRGGFRGGRKPRGDRSENQDADTLSNTSSGATELEVNEEGEKSAEQHTLSEGEFHDEEYHEDEDYIENEVDGEQQGADEVKADKSSQEDSNKVQTVCEEADKGKNEARSENLSNELEDKLRLVNNEPVSSESKKCDVEYDNKQKQLTSDKDDEKCVSNLVIKNTKSIEAEIKEANAKAQSQTNE